MLKETAMQERLYRLAKRLNVGRILRYGDLWTRYLWRRGLSALDAARSGPAGGDAAALGAALAAADMTAAKRMAVASWFPLDLGNAGLQRRMLASLIDERPDLGVTPEILDCLSRLKRADDLAAGVDAMVERGSSAADREHRALRLAAETPPRPFGACHDRLAPSASRPDRDPFGR